jgi:hypothetical protein
MNRKVLINSELGPIYEYLYKNDHETLNALKKLDIGNIYMFIVKDYCKSNNRSVTVMNTTYSILEAFANIGIFNYTDEGEYQDKLEKVIGMMFDRLIHGIRSSCVQLQDISDIRMETLDIMRLTIDGSKYNSLRPYRIVDGMDKLY